MMPIEKLKREFQDALMRHDRALASKLVTEALSDGTVDIPTLYEGILAPSLNHIASNTHPQEVPIWEEHVQSNIVRTVLELSFPFVLKERDKTPSLETPPRALIFCPEEEYHEIGARMTADFLTLLGFDTLFIGANTPATEVISAIKAFNPILVSCSLTNYYYLTKVHKLFDFLKTAIPDPAYKVLVGGYAIFHSSNVKELIQADFYANTFEDLRRLKEALL